MITRLVLVLVLLAFVPFAVEAQPTTNPHASVGLFSADPFWRHLPS
jgi:hypothetical protein